MNSLQRLAKRQLMHRDKLQKLMAFYVLVIDPDLQDVAEHPKCHFERSEKSYNVNKNNIPTIRDR